MGDRFKGNAGKAKAKKQVIDRPDDGARFDYLVWRFGRLDHETQFSCRNLLSADVEELEDELKALQGEPIYSLQKKGWLKFIGADDMTPDGQKALAKVSKQEDGLWQLHLKRHKWRIWGFFEKPEFFFLWWDAGHEVATGRSRHRKT